jgi:hypothetical protein
MKMSNVARTVMIAGCLGLAVTTAFAQDHHAMQHDAHAKPSETGASYACPMHPSVVSDQPGKCSKCGMNLVAKKGAEEHHMAPAHRGEPTIAIRVAPADGLTVGKKSDFIISLNSGDKKPVTFDDLKMAHTKKIHLLIVDPSLTDYHHEHPVATDTPGEFAFSFVPKMSGEYKVFADLVPTSTGEQEYATTTVAVAGDASPVSTSTNVVSNVDGYEVSISFEKPELRAGEANMMTLNLVGKDGKPFAQLEPIMGAYAHLVAFSEDRDNIAHIHPMGTEPTKDSDRGGPTLQFHLEFPEAGFQKLFAQFQIDGKDVFAPFGLNVKPGSGGETSAHHAHGSEMGHGEGHGDVAHGHSEGHADIPDSADGIFDAVAQHMTELDEVVASGELDGVHEIAFNIRDLLLALPAKSEGLSPEQSKSLGSSLKKIKQQAGLLDKFGDAGDAAQTKTVLEKFKTEISAIRELFGATEHSSAASGALLHGLREVIPEGC